METSHASSNSIPHNLGLFRVLRFAGARRHLLQLHEWLTGGDDLPAIAISGEQGNGKSTLSTAAAWNHIHHFSDGIIRVSPAGARPFRIYDVVRTLDTVLGTTLTRTSEAHWGIGILEQLYKRRRLLVLDKLAGARHQEIQTLTEIIGHLHENEGQSRIILIDRNFSPAIAHLVQHQHLHLTGIDRGDMPEFLWKQAPAAVRSQAFDHDHELYDHTGGSPLCLRLALGLLLVYKWHELRDILASLGSAGRPVVDANHLCSLAVETYALENPAAGVLLNRLVRTVGGASHDALAHLFWADLGSDAELERTLAGLDERGLLEVDPLYQRVYIHPVVRRYLDENAAMLGEEWDRRHAAYFVGQAEHYQRLPLERWSEVDLDWGNIFVGADWCAERVTRLCGCDPQELIANSELETQAPGLVPESATAYADLRLARDYALALADYAFWRHPPGIIRWLAVGAVAARSLDDMRTYAWCLMNIGRQMFFLGRLAEAVQWLERARPIFDERDLLSELAYVYTDLGTTYRVLDQPRRALDSFLAAFDCVAQLGDQHGLATAYLNLGSAHFSLDQPERALVEHRKALRVAIRTGDKHLIASVHNNMGLALESLERNEDAIHAYEVALRMFQQTDDATGVSACYNNLGSASYARSDFPQAASWYGLDEQLLERRGAWTDLAATLHNLGHVAAEQGDSARALACFERSRELYAAFDLDEYVAEEEEMIRYLRANKTLTHR